MTEKETEKEYGIHWLWNCKNIAKTPEIFALLVLGDEIEYNEDTIYINKQKKILIKRFEKSDIKNYLLTTTTKE